MHVVERKLTALTGKFHSNQVPLSHSIQSTMMNGTFYVFHLIYSKRKQQNDISEPHLNDEIKILAVKFWSVQMKIHQMSDENPPNWKAQPYQRSTERKMNNTYNRKFRMNIKTNKQQCKHLEMVVKLKSKPEARNISWASIEREAQKYQLGHTRFTMNLCDMVIDAQAGY